MQKDWQSDPHVFVHADDIKTHEQFFNFTKQFLLFKQDKLVSVLTCSMHIENKIMPNSRMQRKLSVLQKKSDHIRVPEK